MSSARLNHAQMRAVTHPGGPLLVLAGAGTGKTRVIAHRIAHLIGAGADPASILALSFTNKAAREVRERAAALVRPGRAEGLRVSTFHALGLEILRREGGRLGLGSGFTLMGEGERRSLVSQIVRELSLPHDPSAVGEALSLWKNRGLAPDEAAAAEPPQAKPLLDAYRLYERFSRAQQAVDFDDLLLLPLRILSTVPDARHHWRTRFRHILVDEYQDTNRVQFELLKVLCPEEGNLCVVGDDDQAIYGWRGAEVELILKFPEHFPGAAVVVLEENYRSTQTVLDAAHRVAAGLAERHPKRLFTSRGSGDPIEVVEAESETDEAEKVTAAILADRFRLGRPWSHYAVLYRTNGQSRAFEQAFRTQDIPHVVLGGTRYFDHKEVRDVLSYLRVMENPRDDASLLRIANVPRRGLGHQTLLKLGEAGRRTGESLHQALARAAELPPQARGGAQALLELLRHYRRRFQSEGLTAAGLEDFIRDAKLREEVRANYESSRAVERRLRLLDELVETVNSMTKGTGRLRLDAFLDAVTIDPPADRDEEGGEAVTLLTLHSAKGLEFPVVFLTGMEEGLLPHSPDGAEPANLEEERRLCYVGMTRAKERLMLTRAKVRSRRGAARAAEPSRFLAEIPESLTDLGGGGGGVTREEEDAMARNFFAGLAAMLEGEKK